MRCLSRCELGRRVKKLRDGGGGAAAADDDDDDDDDNDDDDVRQIVDHQCKVFFFFQPSLRTQ